MVDDLARPVVVLADVGEDGANLLQVRRTALEQQLGGLRVAQDRSQRLVELVRQARGERGHGRHAGRMRQVGVQAKHLGRVLRSGPDPEAEVGRVRGEGHLLVALAQVVRKPRGTEHVVARPAGLDRKPPPARHHPRPHRRVLSPLFGAPFPRPEEHRTALDPRTILGRRLDERRHSIG
ncbi:MAG TPA: hypothetical protein VMT70_15420 [Vicinamibacteria bacterium]|nr:hypothetical protein [Vicinamibacteria bacterium]